MSNETATLVKLSAAEQAAAIKKGDVTSRELVEAHLKVIEAAEPSIKAFLKVSGDVALEQADAFDAKSAEDKAALPELAGVPIAIKDMIVTLVFDIFYMTSDTGTYTSRYLRCCNTYQIIADSFTLSCRNRDACKWHKQAVCTHYLQKLRFVHIHRINPVIIDDRTKSRT